MTESKVSQIEERKSLRFIARSLFNYTTVAILVSLVCIIVGFFELFSFSEQTYKYILALGYVCQVIFFLDFIWHSYTVKTNGRVVTIILKRFGAAYTIRHKDLKNISLNEDAVQIEYSANSTQSIDLGAIKREDQERLVEFLNELTLINENK